MNSNLIQYEDDDILVVLKPAGLAVETKKVSEEDLRSLLRKHCAGQEGKTTQFAPAPVNRLDQPVQGLVLFAKNKEAAGALSRQMQGGDFTKIYEACIYGSMEEKKGRLHSYLYKDAKTNTSKAISKNDPEFAKAKEAILDYEEIAPGILRIRLQTGRHHQIRVQLSETGHPILGDYKYGTEESVKMTKEKQIERLMLTAVELSFTHPVTKKQMTFRCEE